MATFEDLVLIVRNLSEIDRTLGISGRLQLDTPEKLSALLACESDCDDTALTVLDPADGNDIGLGKNVRVQIGTPRPGFGLLSENLEELLCFPYARVKEPSHYLLLDIDYSNSDSMPPHPAITTYRLALEFVAMLKSCAAFLDEQAQVLVFIRNGKFEVPILFSEQDIHSLKTKEIADLSSALEKGVHEKQRASIMAEAVCEMTVMLPPDTRFSSLLSHADDLKDRFEKGYQLFAAGFSYEKIRDEIEAARIEYSGKLHKVISDIQNQLLGIPVAVIVSATQMRESAKIDGNFWISVGVLGGSLIFAILMCFLLRNQRQTLDVIGIEILRQKTKLEKEHASIAKNFVDTFKSLSERYKTQRKILWVIQGSVVVGFLSSAFFFVKMNQSVQNLLLTSFKWLSSPLLSKLF